MAETRRIREESTVSRNATFNTRQLRQIELSCICFIENYRSDYKRRDLLSPVIFSYILLIKNFRNYKAFLLIVLIVSVSRIQGEQKREQFSVQLGRATCRLCTSSGVITMMMTTTGKKHRPLIMTIIIVINKSQLQSCSPGGPLSHPLHLARSQSCLHSF